MATGSVFSPSGPASGVCVFGVRDGDEAYEYISFVRLASVKNGYAPVQNSSGELVLSYVALGRFLWSLQPGTGRLPRYIAGIAVNVDMLGIFQGNVNLQPGDRTYVSGIQLEIINSSHWGSESTEVDLIQIGR